MKDLTDYAVICKGVSVPQENATLRVFPIQTSLPLVDAVKGAASLIPADVDGNMPRSDAGDVLDNVISVQHRSGGYCRMVAKLVAPSMSGSQATYASGSWHASDSDSDSDSELTFTAKAPGAEGNELKILISRDNKDLYLSIYRGDTELLSVQAADTALDDLNDLMACTDKDTNNSVGDFVTIEGSASFFDFSTETAVIQLSGGVNGSVGDVSGIANARGFVLAEHDDSDAEWKPVAVASIDAGIDLTKPELYVAFTFSKTNNYQSVSFSPNAFATIEDLNAINGLNGLHIAYDHVSGDIKLIDKDGKVLDQANLHMDADTIIADGEEGYKYVKTDRNQDIHSAKAFMPDATLHDESRDIYAHGTAWESVDALGYVPANACFLVDAAKDEAFAELMQTSGYAGALSAMATLQAQMEDAQAILTNDPTNAEALATMTDAMAQLGTVSNNLEAAQAFLNTPDNLKIVEDMRHRVIHGESGAVVGIRVYTTTTTTTEGGDPGHLITTTTTTHKDYIFGGEYLNKVTNANGTFLVEAKDELVATQLADNLPEDLQSQRIEEQYSPDAFVWTVGSETGNDTFAQKMNAAAQSMGFHVGDDIPLGTNIAVLINSDTDHMSASGGFDAQKYMHDGDENNYAEDLINEQRNLAKEELAAWNKQHPALIHDPLNGTRISSAGLDVRNGKIEIGNGIANDDNDSVKRYVIETDIPAASVTGGREDRGLQIGVIASQSSTTDNETTVYTDVKKDILTINAENYISGAPTCLALLKCHKADDGNGSTILTADLTETQTIDNEEVTVNVGRITANFLASGEENSGVFTLTITDMRANNGFGDVPRIVEIDPVYKNGADITEAVPVQRSLSAIATAETNQAGHSQISVACTKVLDWAQAIDLGGTVATTEADPDAQQVSGGNYVKPNGQELYLIVKVY